MKRINISCASHASTAICNSMEPLPPPPPPPSQLENGGGGRAIDRHNPIITNLRRSRVVVLPNSSDHDLQMPEASHNKSQGSETKPKNGKNVKDKKNRKQSKAGKPDRDHRRQKQHQHVVIDDENRSYNHKSKSRYNYTVFWPPRTRSDRLMLMKAGCAAARPGEDYLDPPESSRFLLEGEEDDHPDYSLDDGISTGNGDRQRAPADDDGVVAAITKKVDDDGVVLQRVPKPPLAPVLSSHQVVVLRVSLHCKGCEGKVRKHISRMEGVASFNIDFAEKKVTVIGDVTPLGVLSSISKVKNAQLWTQPVPDLIIG